MTDRFSLKEWSFREWVLQNKGDLRNIVVFLITYSYISDFALQSFLIALGVLVGKLALDTFDYWVSA